MSDVYLQLRRIAFKGPSTDTNLEFSSGVNVVCGASDTGKSFLAEAIDYMLGGSELRDIEERKKYAEVELELLTSDDEVYRLRRATTGGNYTLVDLQNPGSVLALKQAHSHGKTDNLSGFLLEKIGLLGKRVLKSGVKATTRSLSFRDLARLVIVQEGEIQQRGSPFWSGQYTTKTAELATVKLLLTGVDDSSVVSVVDVGPDNSRQISLIDELLADLADEIEDSGADRGELVDQLVRLEGTITLQRDLVSVVQRRLDELLAFRRDVFDVRSEQQSRLSEIDNLLARFSLLEKHYAVDLDRLNAIRESGSLFVHVEVSPCPVCGASPDAQHRDSACEGDISAVVLAASSEIGKISGLLTELEATVADLSSERDEIGQSIITLDDRYEAIDKEIQETVAPDAKSFQASFSELIEERALVQRLIDLFARRDKLEDRKRSLEDDGGGASGAEAVKSGIPDSVAHALALKVSAILLAWNFPGDCLVHFDKQSSDFIIDGKHRASRGKGLRAITHAAVNIALLEYCQERGMAHPGFVVLDSPLLAYFKPEGADDLAVKGTDLKERFYEYLIAHHGTESQVLIIENQHPPEGFENKLVMNVFTGNAEQGRFGLL